MNDAPQSPAPQDPPYGQPYPQPQPVPPYGQVHGTAPERKPTSRTAMWVVTGIVSVTFILCAGCLGAGAIGGMGAGPAADTGADPDTGATGAGSGKAKTARIGEAVRDGKFEFKVATVKCGKATVGSQYAERKAQGQFCLVDLTVKNIGDEPQMFNDFEQLAYDADGKKYEVDSEAGWAANENTTDVWLNDINPGNKVTGVLVYDIPENAKLTRIELHDSSLSDGVVVTI